MARVAQFTFQFQAEEVRAVQEEDATVVKPPIKPKGLSRPRVSRVRSG
jgi:hypothetical protein